LSKIVTPFLVFEEHRDPNTVITLADNRGDTLAVSLLELLCHTRLRFKKKEAVQLNIKNDGLPKTFARGC